MKAVILAAGVGIRMRPLTLTTPKPLLKVNGKPIIEYVLASLPPQINEVIIVVDYLGNQIKEYIGKKNLKLKVTFVTGSNKGSAYSFMVARKYLSNERFLVVYGDEIPNPTDIKNCLTKELSILTFISHKPHAHGIAYLRKNGTIGSIIEKPKNPPSNLAIDGVMVVNTDIFTHITPSFITGEYYFSTLVGLFVRDHKVYPIPAQDFIGDITTPDDLLRVGKLLRACSKSF